MNLQCDRLPDGLTAPQLVEHCTVSPMSWVRILFRPEFFSGLNFITAYVVYITGMINHVFICYPQFKYMIFRIFICIVRTSSKSHVTPLHEMVYSWFSHDVTKILQNYWSSWDFSLIMYKSRWELIFIQIFAPNGFLVWWYTTLEFLSFCIMWHLHNGLESCHDG